MDMVLYRKLYLKIGAVILLDNYKFKRGLLAIGGTVVAMLLFNYFSKAKNIEAAVYSWYELQVENVDHTVEAMSTHDIDSIYQFVSSNHLSDDQFVGQLNQFVNQVNEANKRVYFLNGEAEWALVEEKNELITYVKEVIEYKEAGHPVQGFVLDIEPQSLEEYQDDPKAVWGTLVDNLKEVYGLTKAANMELIVCLPYYLDTQGFDEELEAIISEASDEVAIMNYYRGKEIDHIAKEVSVSKQYDKSIQTVYELQQVGIADLTAQNTYHDEGLVAMIENFEALTNHYSNQEIHLGIHEFNSLLELTALEEE